MVDVVYFMGKKYKRKKHPFISGAFCVRDFLNLRRERPVCCFGVGELAMHQKSLPLEGKGDRLRWMRCRMQSIREKSHLISQLTLTASPRGEALNKTCKSHAKMAPLPKGGCHEVTGGYKKYDVISLRLLPTAKSTSL